MPKLITSFHLMNLQDKEIFEKALKLKNANRHKPALKIFHTLESRYSRYSPLYGVIAWSYYEIGDLKMSIKYYKKTLKLNPNSELASLGLFCSLLQIGKTKEAFIEMDRYLSINKPKLYKTTLSEMNENIGFWTKSYQQSIIRKHS